MKDNNFQSVGQFFTQKNVFEHPVFINWWQLIENPQKILEPFAGKNGIVDMLKQIPEISKQISYISYDIIPGHEEVLYRDTIKDFPIGFNVVVTNPPFLAKNSATRRGMNYLIEPYNDLYERCLSICLNNTDYLAAIIPESFITSQFFKNRLYAVISLAHKKIFKDTEQPVCLALFIKEKTNNFDIYRNETLLGNYKELKNIDNQFCAENSNFKIDFHRIDGQVGFISTDSTNYKKCIKMVNALDIIDADVNEKARLRTRVKISKENKVIKVDSNFIFEFNIFLNNYRLQTQDVFLTSFKGLRDDGLYRRRMSFTKLRSLLLCFLNNSEISK